MFPDSVKNSKSASSYEEFVIVRALLETESSLTSPKFMELEFNDTSNLVELPLQKSSI